MAFSRLKIAVVAPIPRARIEIAARAKPLTGLFVRREVAPYHGADSESAERRRSHEPHPDPVRPGVSGHVRRSEGIDADVGGFESISKVEVLGR